MGVTALPVVEERRKKKRKKERKGREKKERGCNSGYLIMYVAFKVKISISNTHVALPFFTSIFSTFFSKIVFQKFF